MRKQNKKLIKKVLVKTLIISLFFIFLFIVNIIFYPYKFDLSIIVISFISAGCIAVFTLASRVGWGTGFEYVRRKIIEKEPEFNMWKVLLVVLVIMVVLDLIGRIVIIFK